MRGAEAAGRSRIGLGHCVGRGLAYASYLPSPLAATDEYARIMTTAAPVAVCLKLTQAISRTRTAGEIYAIALEALAEGLGVSRAAILLFDAGGVMRFVSWRNISDTYRSAAEGHSPWRPDAAHPEPLVVADVTLDPSFASLLPAINDEGIAAMT